MLYHTKKMLNTCLVKDKWIIALRCQCSMRLGEDQDAYYHVEGGRVPKSVFLQGHFWESKLKSPGLSPQTLVAVREDGRVQAHLWQDGTVQYRAGKGLPAQHSGQLEMPQNPGKN